MTDENERPEGSPEAELNGEGGVERSQAETELEMLRAENAELKDRVLRVAAEMENLRKRTVREVSDARTYAIADFARDMLGATDNLERALVSMPDELRQVTDPAIKSLIEGIEMTEREMQRLMQKNGVRPILSEGEKFDPHKHQAMFEVPDESVPAGTVVQVVQSGFEIGNRVLRPAMVGVAKGGASAQTEPAPEGDPDGFGDLRERDGNPQSSAHVDKQA